MGGDKVRASRGEIKIEEVLTKAGLVFEEEYSFAGLNSPNGRPLRFDFAVFDDDGHTVGIRSFRFARAKEDCFVDVLKTCNELNTRFRWVKFSVDHDYDVNVEIDCIVNEETAGEVVLELVQRLCSIADDAYPELMRAIYGSK